MQDIGPPPPDRRGRQRSFEMLDGLVQRGSITGHAVPTQRRTKAGHRSRSHHGVVLTDKPVDAASAHQADEGAKRLWVDYAACRCTTGWRRNRALAASARTSLITYRAVAAVSTTPGTWATAG